MCVFWVEEREQDMEPTKNENNSENKIFYGFGGEGGIKGVQT